MSKELREEKKIGLVAGYGDMPVEIIKSAQREGYEIVCIALRGMAHDHLDSLTSHSLYVDLGEIEKTIEFLKSHDVSEVFFAGKVEKTRLFSPDFKMDQSAMNLLKSLPKGNDDTILLGLAELFAQTGLKVLDSTRFLKTILPKKGILTDHDIPRNVEEDIKYGYDVAKAIAKLDIGQTIVVKNKTVLAVEAIEGTDQAVLRGGEFGKGGAVAIKVAKPQQDLRFDVPTIGIGTILSCVEAGVCALAFDSGTTILLNSKEVLKMARAKGIHLISL
ncbi:UDP-2,3-diacylglucosamine diphosphatase LpxI [bacterium]|jgi:UDP-2,3-diacylglucosamine hydrolase|nr:UDP-2,3-diacylglucosamine diphosphatase LpxI [bacterium]